MPRGYVCAYISFLVFFNWSCYCSFIASSNWYKASGSSKNQTLSKCVYILYIHVQDFRYTSTPKHITTWCEIERRGEGTWTVDTHAYLELSSGTNKCLAAMFVRTCTKLGLLATRRRCKEKSFEKWYAIRTKIASGYHCMQLRNWNHLQVQINTLWLCLCVHVPSLVWFVGHWKFAIRSRRVYFAQRQDRVDRCPGGPFLRYPLSHNMA